MVVAVLHLVDATSSDVLVAQGGFVVAGCGVDGCVDVAADGFTRALGGMLVCCWVGWRSWGVRRTWTRPTPFLMAPPTLLPECVPEVDILTSMVVCVRRDSSSIY